MYPWSSPPRWQIGVAPPATSPLVPATSPLVPATSPLVPATSPLVPATSPLVLGLLLFFAGSILPACQSDDDEPCPIGTERQPSGECRGVLPLLIEVVQPQIGTSTTSSILRVEGIVSPVAETVSFQNRTNDQRGSQAATNQWALNVPLSPGDNNILFTATAGTRTSTVEYFTVLSTDVVFFNQPAVTPSFIAEGAAEPIRIVWGVTPARPNLVISGVDVVRDDADRSVLLSLADNGQLPIDEIASDNLFSGVLSAANVSDATNNASESLILRARVRFQLDGEAAEQTILSPPFLVKLRRILTQPDVRIIQETNVIVDTLLDTLAADESNFAEVLSEIETRILAHPQVRTVTRGDTSWSFDVQYERGFISTVFVPLSGARGGVGGELEANDAALQVFGAPSIPLLVQQRASFMETTPRIQSRRVLALSPFMCEFQTTDEGNDIRELYNSNACPNYETDFLSNEEVTLDVLRTASTYGVVHITTHGDANATQEWITIREPFNTITRQRYRNDLAYDPITGEADVHVISIADSCNPGASLMTFRVNPSFFRNASRNQPYPDSLVFMSACRSTFNGSFASAFLGSGARSFLGFSDYVSSSFARERSIEFHADFRRGEQPDESLFTPGLTDTSVIDRLVEQFELTDNTPAEWQILSSGVTTAAAGLLNGDFEEAGLNGWIIVGDGRRIPSLGTAGPQEGEFLGLISTGLGFTQQATIIKQNICVPSETQQLRLSRNFLSEEFPEFCSSQFQDFFDVSIIQNGTNHTLLREQIDDLCSLTSPTNLFFDQGGVEATGWREYNLPLPEDIDLSSSFELRLECGDVGDSVFDSAILLDNIRFQ